MGAGPQSSWRFGSSQGQANLRQHNVLDPVIKTQWFPNMAFPKHSRPRVWRFVFLGQTNLRYLDFCDNMIKTRWLPCMTFPKHSRPPVGRFSLNSVPAKFKCKSFFCQLNESSDKKTMERHMFGTRCI